MPRKTTTVQSIGLDTGIMPDMVAESVVEKAAVLLDAGFSERDVGYYAGRLVEQAETLYLNNPDFRKKIRSERDGGNAGRDSLYAFMQHWLSARLLKESANRADWRRILVDSGFSVGR
jgi:hypothetical protein